MDHERLRPWRTIATRRIVDTRYLHLRADTIELPDGTRIDDYFVRESLGFCVIFALTTERHVVLVEQYKYGADTMVLEMPAGMIDPGETAEACAARELREETGFAAPRLEHLRTFLTEPTSSNGLFHLYLARDARLTDKTQFDHSEDIVTTTVPLAEFRTMLVDGRIATGSQVAAGWTALEALAVSGPAQDAAGGGDR